MANKLSDAMGEVITTVPTDMAMRQAEVGAMRELNNTMNRFAAEMVEFRGELKIVTAHVTTMAARDYDKQIIELKSENDKKEERQYKEMQQIYDRLRASEVQNSKYGFALAIVGSIATLAAGSIITVIVMHLFK